MQENSQIGTRSREKGPWNIKEETASARNGRERALPRYDAKIEEFEGTRHRGRDCGEREPRCEVYKNDEGNDGKIARSVGENFVLLPGNSSHEAPTETIDVLAETITDAIVEVVTETIDDVISDASVTKSTSAYTTANASAYTTAYLSSREDHKKSSFSVSQETYALV
jgi:hypothetical protein